MLRKEKKLRYNRLLFFKLISVAVELRDNKSYVLNYSIRLETFDLDQNPTCSSYVLFIFKNGKICTVSFTR